MKISIRQQLSLGMGSGLAHAAQHLLLTPQSGPTQSVLEWSVDLPGIDGASRFTDGFGNTAMLVTQTKPDDELVITINGIVDTIDRNGVVGRLPGDPPHALFRRPTAATKAIGAITSKFRSAPRAGADRIALLHALMARVGEVLGESGHGQSQSQSQGSQTQSMGGMTQSQDGQSQSQNPPAAVPLNSEACAHAFIGAARALDIPTRFVTGYMLGAAPDAAFHAWAEAWDDGLGWIAFDPLLQLCPTDSHVRMAVGLDAQSAVPVRSAPASVPAVLSMSVEKAA